MTDTFDNRLTRVPIYTSSPEDVPGPEPMVIPPQLVPTEASPQEPWYSRAGNALLGVLDQFGVAGLPEGERREATREARNKLLHIGSMEEQDYLWPEKMLRSAVTLAGDVRTGNVPPPGLRREDYTDIPADPSKVGGTPHDDLIQRVQDMAGLAMTGGLAGTGAGGKVLGSGPVPVERNFKDVAYPHAKMERGDWARYNRAVENGDHTEVELPLRALNATQKTVNPDFMSVKNDELPAVLKKGGEYYIQDGHHRLMREAASGKQTARVRLYDVDPSSRDPRQLTLLSSNESAAPLAALEHLTTGQLDDAARVVANKPYKELDHTQQQRAQKLALETVHAKNEAAAPLAALEKRAPVWYSPVEQALENSTQARATGAQWLATLRNSRGVKPEELDWTGLRQYLEERADQPVSRLELHEYLRDNRVELQDVTKGKKGFDYDKVRDELEPEAIAKVRRNNPGINEESDRFYSLVQDYVNARMDRMEADALKEGSTKYHSYQLPGGENYREHLITMPIRSDLEKLRGFAENRGVSNIAEAQRLYQEKYGELPQGSDNYKSSHWDEPNIVAHVRSNVREMPSSDGQGPVRSLHLEEVQSDWHQAGRRRGYASGESGDKLVDELRSALERGWLKVSGGRYKKYSEARAANEIDLFEMHRKVSEVPEVADVQRRLIAAREGVPDAPWKKTWHELALRRMIRLAAEEGMDRISWTPGEAQAARYDLSKQIDNLRVWPDKDGKYYFEAKKANRDLGLDKGKSYTPEQLEEVIGKDMTKKAVEDLKAGKDANYSGLDLKVGGEGMRGFYDKMMVQAAEKLGREYGVKVKKSELTGGEATVERNGIGTYHVMQNGQSVGPTYKTKQEAQAAADKLPKQEVWYFDIPPAMRSAALGRGMPLFSGGKMFVPSGAQGREEREQ